MQIGAIIDLAADHYIPSNPDLSGRAADEDRVLQLLTDAFMAFVNGFGNNVNDTSLVLRWHHEQGEMAVWDTVLAEKDKQGWEAGFKGEGLDQTRIGPFPSFQLARDALIIVLRKAMSNAFEMFDTTRAIHLREILETLKDDNLPQRNFIGEVPITDENWFITLIPSSSGMEKSSKEERHGNTEPRDVTG